MKTKLLLDAMAIKRSITRIAHEILERNNGPENIILVGIITRGVPLSKRVQAVIKSSTDVQLLLGTVDITFHRDDYRERLVVPQVKGTDLPAEIDGKTVVLVDDVLFPEEQYVRQSNRYWLMVVRRKFSLLFW